MEDRSVHPGSKPLVLFVLSVLLCCWAAQDFAWSAEKDHLHVVVLGDPHVPGRNVERKERLIQTINSWTDVDMVVAVGDICADRGKDEEYEAAKILFKMLRKPFYPIAGNHDFIYESEDPNGGRPISSPRSRDSKLAKFNETFGLPGNCYTKTIGRYLALFISPEGLGHLAEISDRQIEWLRAELNSNRKTPTMIFFHAPLNGTLYTYRKFINTSDFVAQPVEKLDELLMDNPQVFLWVSGHTHTPPTEESFASRVNLYEKRIANLHNTDLNKDTIWTNSLFVYPDEIKVRTYNHTSRAWLPELDRAIVSPAQPEALAPASSKVFGGG